MAGLGTVLFSYPGLSTTYRPTPPLVKVVDVRALVSGIAPRERGHCALWGNGGDGNGAEAAAAGAGAGAGEGAQAMGGGGGGGWLSVGGWAAALQQWYDPQCGLCAC